MQLRSFFICSMIFIGCSFFYKTVSAENLFIQIRLDNPTIRALQQTIEPLINTIIQEELKVERGCDYPRFLLKGRQDISLYYVIDLKPDLDSHIVGALDEMQHKNKGTNAPKDSALSLRTDFFGDKDELVMLLDDPHQELTALHKDIKQFAHKAQMQYQAKYSQDLYDVIKSERYPFKPHISLGRLQGDSIKKMVCGADNADQVLQRIKERIHNEVMPTAIAPLDKRLQPTYFVIFNETKKQVSKTYPLK